jgi:hypothetical protein
MLMMILLSLVKFVVAIIVFLLFSLAFILWAKPRGWNKGIVKASIPFGTAVFLSWFTFFR